jgi:hypothetical protein
MLATRYSYPELFLGQSQLSTKNSFLRIDVRDEALMRIERSTITIKRNKSIMPHEKENVSIFTLSGRFSSLMITIK